MRDRSPDRKPQIQDREDRLFDSAWGWLTAALIGAVAVAIIAITANVLWSTGGVAPLAMRPPADDPANPPAAAAPNTSRTRDGVPAR
jgi:hypothetical protein